MAIKTIAGFSDRKSPNSFLEQPKTMLKPRTSRNATIVIYKSCIDATTVSSKLVACSTTKCEFDLESRKEVGVTFQDTKEKTGMNKSKINRIKRGIIQWRKLPKLFDYVFRDRQIS
eukprot:GAHX01007127.1.p1 GENE.GAHX01007127.1~~GAHX01007127.1.p1  ORF type:complete len:116 (-),score=6.89 GAHX01007127.1:104-451(-)